MNLDVGGTLCFAIGMKSPLYPDYSFFKKKKKVSSLKTYNPEEPLVQNKPALFLTKKAASPL